jgi:uncharacterized membrane protein YqjE
MVGEKTMNERNGSGAAQRVARNVYGLAHDAVTLTGLQIKLLKIDVQESAAGVLKPLLLVGGAFVLVLGSVPIGLAGLACILVEVAGWPFWSALLVAFAVVVGVGAGLLWAGWKQLRQIEIVRVFAHSRAELQRNVTWVKQQLAGQGEPERRESRTGRSP